MSDREEGILNFEFPGIRLELCINSAFKPLVYPFFQSYSLANATCIK